MIGWNGLEVFGVVLIGSWSVFYGLVGAIVGVERLRTSIQRRYWVTHHRNTCPTCLRVEVYERTRYQGVDFADDRFETCTICRIDRGDVIEWDLDRMTADDFRAIQ